MKKFFLNFGVKVEPLNPPPHLLTRTYEYTYIIHVRFCCKHNVLQYCTIELHIYECTYDG